MNTTRLTNLDRTLHLSKEWIRELNDRLDWGDDRRAYRLLRETIQAVRDWLTVDEAAHLSSQLPSLIRGIYFEGWHPASTPVLRRSKKDFIQRILKQFENDPIDDPEAAVSEVFGLLNRRITDGEISDIKSCLPKSLRSLWPDE